MNRVPSLLTLLALTAGAMAEPPATQPAAFTVTGEGVTPLSLSPQDLAALPRHTLKVKGHDGKDAAYDGVLVRDVLLKAGVPIGEHRLKGPLIGRTVVAFSADGYRTAFGLAEFDADYAEREILLADTRDGHPLDAKEGPYRLVVPQEARQGRWARMVTALRIVPPPADAR